MKLDGYIDKDCSARFTKKGFLSAVSIVYLYTGSCPILGHGLCLVSCV